MTSGKSLGHTPLQAAQPNDTAMKINNAFLTPVTKSLSVAILCVLFAGFSGTSAFAIGTQEAPPTQEQEDKKKEKYEKGSEDKNKAESAETTEQEGKKDTDEKTEQKSDSDKSSSARRRGRRSRSRASSRTSNGFLDAFKSVIGPTAKATVEIRKNDKPVALGAIVSADGYVLTKLSELKAPIKCRLPDGKDVAAYVYGVHPDTDLALLKVEGDNLPVIPWTTEARIHIVQERTLWNHITTTRSMLLSGPLQHNIPMTTTTSPTATVTRMPTLILTHCNSYRMPALILTQPRPRT